MKAPRNSNEVVIESITQAMAVMVIEQPFDTIKVTALVRRAGVSRNSYYRNFSDLDDVMRRYIQGETDDWMAANGWVHTIRPEEQQISLLQLLEHMYDYRSLVAALMRDGKMYLLENEFDRAFQIGISEYYDPWKYAFLTGGIWKTYVHWVETGYRQTPKEIADYFSTFQI